MNNCPMCGVGSHSIREERTLLYDIENEVTYHCTSCGACWKVTEYETKSKYGILNAWLVENYAERPDVETVYEAMVNLLNKLDEYALSGLR